MAEEESELELDRFKEELESLLSGEGALQSRTYCARFCELVEEYTSRWQVPLPQLQVLRSALCSFVRGASSFPSDCEHVRYTLSSLALSVFELLLFFGRDEFPEDPLKDILDSFQECQSSLVRYQNVYLLQVKHIIRDGGPWASSVLEGILKEVEQRQEEVDHYLGSEASMFFELRVRYLLACERMREAMALALKCSQHPSAGRRLFFKQVHLACLWKSSQQERLVKEMAEIDGKDAVEILCIAENEEKDELLLELSRGFLLQQLRSGDMYYLWDLVFIWCKLYLRVKAKETPFLQECKLLLLSATNVKAIFPFMKVILAENLGKEGLTFCIELCAQALQTDLKNDSVTKSLIYKTIAYLFPNDLEICRACALLVFFLERTVEAYKTVFFLYNHPDLEYHLDNSPVVNNVRFEVIQILKKGLFFDPEFWSLLNIKTNCLKLMSDEVARAALCEITEEDKWESSYCVREHCKCHAEPERTAIRQEVKPGSRERQETGTVEKWFTSSSANVSSEAPRYKKRGRKPGSRSTISNLEPFPVRRSFRQLDLAQNHTRQLNSRCQRFLTRQTENNILKRRGRKPRWLLEQLAALGENSTLGQRKKPGRKPKLLSSIKDILVATPVIEITMEYSYPDNEVELPADVQGRPASRATSSTEHSFDQPQMQMSRGRTPDSLFQLLSEKSPRLWRDEDDFQPHEVMVAISKFHTYAKVPEQEESPSLDRLTDAAAAHAATHAATLEDDFRSLAPVKKPSEPVEAINMTSPTAAVTLEIPGLSDVADLPLLSPVDQDVVPDSKINTTTVFPSKDQTVTDDIPEPENTQEVANLSSTPDKATDFYPTTSVMLSTSENTPELTPQSNVSTPKEIPDTPEYPLKDEVAVSGIILKSSASVEELASQQTTEVEPHRGDESLPVSGSQTYVQCRLCDKSYEAPLTHALWHYRKEKKCMFCDKPTLTRGALQHFQKHIKNLNNAESPHETKKSEDVSEAPGKPVVPVPESPPKKAKPGFAQIKSRLLMRLKLTRKAQPQREAEKTSDNTETALKETDTKKQASAPDQKESGAKDEKQSVPQETIRYLTRGSVRKAEHKGRLRRTKISREGKARTIKIGKDKSEPKDGSVHRLNGVIQKKRFWCLQDDRGPVTVPPVKKENKTNAEKTTRKEKKANYDIRTKATINNESRHCAKVKEEPRVKKKRHREDEENVEVKAVKKLKKEEGASIVKSTDTVGEPPKVENQQNGTEEESSESSKSIRKRKASNTSLVSCPRDACTFQAMPGPVLSHVLIHHPGDTKALEFFYNLGEKKCLVCTRRIWTPQHFFDHIASHRGNLKHPCYHATCQKRFKTRSDAGDHMEKNHNPLKAGCCFHGCTVQSASLKDLYSHEKSHYKAVTLKKGTSVTSEKSADKPSLGVTNTQAQQATESVETDPEVPTLLPSPPSPPAKVTQHKTPVKPEDEKPLTLNRSSVNYSSKNSRLINGHNDHPSSVKAPPTAEKEQEPKHDKKVAVKPFSRLPPSAYLDELYLSMPKKWRGPQANAKGTDPEDGLAVKRQSCSRCNAAFNCEGELQLHREKCTSLFGFDSDDES
ncbi:zinc finger protein 654, partial [Silurus meridionalis]